MLVIPWALVLWLIYIYIYTYYALTLGPLHAHGINIFMAMHFCTVVILAIDSDYNSDYTSVGSNGGTIAGITIGVLLFIVTIATLIIVGVCLRHRYVKHQRLYASTDKQQILGADSTNATSASCTTPVSDYIPSAVYHGAKFPIDGCVTVTTSSTSGNFPSQPPADYTPN